MDRRVVRAAAPALYALAVLIAALFASSTVLIGVLLIGAVLVGLIDTMLEGHRGGRSRNRNRK